jgi:hypothetical protein
METIDVDGCDYLIIVRCHKCRKNNAVDGHDNGHHPSAEVLRCGYCSTESWLGIDTESNVLGEPIIETGLPFGS